MLSVAKLIVIMLCILLLSVIIQIHAMLIVIMLTVVRGGLT
jgi:hypothetical protein